MKYKLHLLSLSTILILNGCGGAPSSNINNKETGVEVTSGLEKVIKGIKCDSTLEECPAQEKIIERCGNRGGEMFYFGYDENFNGILDQSEIDASKDVIICNGYQGIQGEQGESGLAGKDGNDGADGVVGDQGFSSLINSEEISQGNICKSGGIKFDTGLDTNSNQLLDAGEVSESRVICLPDLLNQSITKIHEVQGSNNSTPLKNEIVTVEAIVIADYQDSAPHGFYIQEEDADVDENPETSEAVFVYDPSFIADVEVGDKVRLTGKVTEFYDLTEIKDLSEVTVVSHVAALPTAVDVQLPMASDTEYEKYEGMLVKFSQKLVTTEVYNLGKYGEVLLSSTDRLWQPTQIAAPGDDAKAIEETNKLNQIILDDLISGKYPETIVHPGAGLSKLNVLRGGDTVTDLTGIISYGYSKYRVLPVGEVNFAKENPRVDMPAVNGDFKVASLNVLNYFKTIDDGSSVCGTHDQGCRGADSAEEFARQSAKMIAALEAMNADVIGLMEIQNDGGETLQSIVDQLAGYEYVRNPNGEGSELGTDIITVAMLYKSAKVELVGTSHTIADGVYQGAFDKHNRKPLAQTFKDKESGEVFTIINNHLKSKGRLTDIAEDADQRDGQGNNNYTRTKAAEDLVSWAADLKETIGDEDFLIIGDLNAYAKEDPITTLQNNGFVNLDGDGKAYSYVYYGQWGTLDYALADAALNTKVAEVKRWKINADESWLFDYNDDDSDANYGRPKPVNFLSDLYEPNAYRMSDHDPIIVGFNFAGSSVPTPTPASRTLFFSEYIEGSSNNKALEVFNATDESVDLSAYTIEIYANGKTKPNTPILLSGILQSKNVFVIAHPSAAGGIEADMTGSLYYNGDDAVVLKRNGEIIDVIGQIGIDPGSEWGSGYTSTKDNTIRRKAGITQGDSDASNAFDPSVEWDGFAKDSFDGLGVR